MDLRDKIVSAIRGQCFYSDQTEGVEGIDFAADAILAIPEIRDALHYRNVVLASQMPDLPPDRVGAILQDLANRTAD